MIQRGLAWSAIILSVMTAASAYGWMALPPEATFPVHWTTDGTPDRFAGKLETLGAMPTLAAFLTIIFALGPHLFPRAENVQKSRDLYITGWVGGLALIGLSHGAILYSALSGEGPSLRLFFIANGLFLMVLGNFMAKSKPNWIAGIKTPWTLDSDYSWSLTNRFAGRSFVLVGLLTMIASLFFDLEKTMIAMLTGLAASVVVSVLISYLAWRRDPERL